MGPAATPELVNVTASAALAGVACNVSVASIVAMHPREVPDKNFMCWIPASRLREPECRIDG